jgi:hypothetical protein
MTARLLEDAEIKLLRNCVRGVSQFDWIRNLLLDLRRRAIPRFRMAFTAPAAFAAYVLFNEV